VLDDRERAAFMATLGKLAAVAGTRDEDETADGGAAATERAEAR
jgi:hypothetical protein